jgi:hypothetical protein
MLLGLISLLSGTNGFVRFGRAPSFETAVARDYLAVMPATPYGHILFGLQILWGLLVIADLFVPLALT